MFMPRICTQTQSQTYTHTYARFSNKTIKDTLKEFNHVSTTMIVFASLQNFMSCKSSTPTKSMPKKNNHDFKKYPYIREVIL